MSLCGTVQDAEGNTWHWMVEGGYWHVHPPIGCTVADLYRRAERGEVATFCETEEQRAARLKLCLGLNGVLASGEERRTLDEHMTRVSRRQSFTVEADEVQRVAAEIYTASLMS